MRKFMLTALVLTLLNLPAMAQAQSPHAWQKEMSSLAWARPQIYQDGENWCLEFFPLRNPASGEIVRNGPAEPVCVNKAQVYRGVISFGTMEIPSDIKMFLFDRRPHAMSSNAKYEKKNLEGASSTIHETVNTWEVLASIPTMSDQHEASLSLTGYTEKGDKIIVSYEGGKNDNEKMLAYVTSAKNLTCYSNLPGAKTWCIGQIASK